MTNNQENTNNLANENTSSTNNGTTEQVHYSIGRIVFVIIFLFFAIWGLVDKISDISHYEKDYSQEAYTAAKFYVNKQLKALPRQIIQCMIKTLLHIIMIATLYHLMWTLKIVLVLRADYTILSLWNVTARIGLT